MPKTLYGLTDKERDLVLAALRFYQRGKERGDIPKDIEDIERNCRRKRDTLDTHDIDGICYLLNFGER